MSGTPDEEEDEVFLDPEVQTQPMDLETDDETPAAAKPLVEPYSHAFGDVTKAISFGADKEPLLNESTIVETSSTWNDVICDNCKGVRLHKYRDLQQKSLYKLVHNSCKCLVGKTECCKEGLRNTLSTWLDDCKLPKSADWYSKVILPCRSLIHDPVCAVAQFRRFSQWVIREYDKEHKCSRDYNRKFLSVIHTYDDEREEGDSEVENLEKEYSGSSASFQSVPRRTNFGEEQFKSYQEFFHIRKGKCKFDQGLAKVPHIHLFYVKTHATRGYHKCVIAGLKKSNGLFQDTVGFRPKVPEKYLQYLLQGNGRQLSDDRMAGRAFQQGLRRCGEDNAEQEASQSGGRAKPSGLERFNSASDCELDAILASEERKIQGGNDEGPHKRKRGTNQEAGDVQEEDGRLTNGQSGDSNNGWLGKSGAVRKLFCSETDIPETPVNSPSTKRDRKEEEVEDLGGGGGGSGANTVARDAKGRFIGSGVVRNDVQENKARNKAQYSKMVNDWISNVNMRCSNVTEVKQFLYKHFQLFRTTKTELISVCSEVKFEKHCNEAMMAKFLLSITNTWVDELELINRMNSTALNYFFPVNEYLSVKDSAAAILQQLDTQGYDFSWFFKICKGILDKTKDKSNALLFLGPPNTGKTKLAESITDAFTFKGTCGDFTRR